MQNAIGRKLGAPSLAPAGPGGPPDPAATPNTPAPPGMSDTPGGDPVAIILAAAEQSPLVAAIAEVLGLKPPSGGPAGPGPGPSPVPGPPPGP